MRFLKVKRPFLSAQRAHRYMMHHAKLASRPLIIPRLKARVSSTHLNGSSVVTLHPFNHPAKGTIVMLHGGAYVRQPLNDHWRFADRLVTSSGWQVIMPIYPKAPNHTVLEAIELVNAVLDLAIESNQAVILMGDSSGGGLALAVTEERGKQRTPCPQQVILISPWLDIAVRNPHAKALEAEDPILAIEGLREMGRVWSGGLSPDDPRVSPLFGLLPELPPITVIVGSNEIFYPDALTLNREATALGVKCSLIIGDGLFHDYPLFEIPEAQKALTAIVDIINNHHPNESEH
jgi:acetyl esterase/lipase